MKALSEKQLDAAKQAAAYLNDAAGDMRVLTSLKWDMSLRDKFLKTGLLLSLIHI